MIHPDGRIKVYVITSSGLNRFLSDAAAAVPGNATRTRTGVQEENRERFQK
jgi:hypothetical protein